jgi:hypothetical protein
MPSVSCAQLRAKLSEALQVQMHSETHDVVLQSPLRSLELPCNTIVYHWAACDALHDCGRAEEDDVIKTQANLVRRVCSNWHLDSPRV